MSSFVISQRIKALLALKNRKAVELAAYMGLSRQSLNNKFSRGTFTVDDLIKIAAFTGTTLSFNNDTGNIILGEDCLKSADKKEPVKEEPAEDEQEVPNLIDWLNQPY